MKKQKAMVEKIAPSILRIGNFLSKEKVRFQKNYSYFKIKDKIY